MSRLLLICLLISTALHLAVIGWPKRMAEPDLNATRAPSKAVVPVAPAAATPEAPSAPKTQDAAGPETETETETETDAALRPNQLPLLVLEGLRDRNTIRLVDLPGQREPLLDAGMTLLMADFSTEPPRIEVDDATRGRRRIAFDTLESSFGRQILYIDEPRTKQALLAESGFDPARTTLGLFLGLPALDAIARAIQAEGIDVGTMSGKQLTLAMGASSHRWQLLALTTRPLEKGRE